MKNTLQVKITNIRRDGNTTRQINFAIKTLFKKGKIKVLSHDGFGNNHKHNLALLNRIKLRLQNEHSGILHRIKFNTKSCIIYKMSDKRIIEKPIFK